MTTKKPRTVFVNLPVKDLQRSKDFFGKLGFEFNPQFSDHNAACMILSEQGFVMLLDATYFKTFTKREIADSTKVSEGLIALSCESRAEVDELVKIAMENGGTAAMPTMDHGFMYGHSFYDPDGHHWEVIWMDPSAIQKPE